MNTNDFNEKEKTSKNNKFPISSFIIKDSIDRIFQINNNNVIMNTISIDTETFIDKFEISEKLYIKINKFYPNIFRNFERKIKYIIKLYSKKKNFLIKNKNKLDSIEFLIFIIYSVQKYLNTMQHSIIKNILVYSIILSLNEMIEIKAYNLLVEIFINAIIIFIFKENNKKFLISDEPVCLIIDVIFSLLEIKETSDNFINSIFFENISIFEKYLTDCEFGNISFINTSIWFNLLKNNFSNDLNANKKINDFLKKTYKYNLPEDYFSLFINKSTINFDYFIKSLNFLKELFSEEEKLKSSKDFKIVKGFILTEEKALILQNLKLKLEEFSIIFSFRISNKVKQGVNIHLLNMHTKDKLILNMSIDKNKNLIFEYSHDKKWETGIKIKLGKAYLVCISQKPKLLGKNKLRLFINEAPITQDDKDGHGKKVKNTDACYYYWTKASFLDFSKTIFLELGKTNFSGMIGEFFICNKGFNKRSIHFLFNLKENYSEVLSCFLNKYDLIESNELISDNDNYNYFYINKDNVNVQNLKTYLGNEIKLEIMTNKVNQFDTFKSLKHSSVINIVNKSNLENESLDKKANNSSDNLEKVEILKNNNTDDITIKENIKIFKLKFSAVDFFYEKGLDFLTFQLYNIFSTLNDNIELINFYLNKIVSFAYDLMINLSKYIIDNSDKQFPKIDQKFNIFFMTLFITLNKKKQKIFLSKENHKLLIELLDYLRFSRLYALRNIVYGILLEEKLFENQKDSLSFPKIFNSFLSDLTDNSNSDISMITHEFLYKILLFDCIFETKNKKHKMYMKLITAFITIDTIKKNENLQKILPVLIEEFIKYIVGIKDEKKTYHYLKIIYINSSNIKSKLLENASFVEYVNIKKEKKNVSHCKYCMYNQILCYLINEEIYLNQSSPDDANDYCFHYNPTGFMKSPNSFFVRCIFIQCFNLSNTHKLKFIKSNLEGIEYIKEILSNNNSNLTDTAKLINYSKFIPKFKAFVDYIKFLFDEQQNQTNDRKLIDIIDDSINLLLSLLSDILRTKQKLSINNEIAKNKNVKDDNKKFCDFFNELISCSAMKMLFSLYLSLNYVKALREISNYIKLSIKEIYNPFYFFLFSTGVIFDNDTSDIDNNDSIQNNNNTNIGMNNFGCVDNAKYIKSYLLNLLTVESTKQKMLNKDKTECILVQNNILLLIYIYHNLVNNKLNITDETEKNLILYINYLIDNNFNFSKYVFDINFSLNSNNSDVNQNHNYKFLSEIITEILFNLYETKKFDLKYQYLIKEFFIHKNKKKSDKNINSNFYLIDEQTFLDKNMSPTFKFFNKSYLAKICNGIELNEIMLTIYFMFYLIEKKNKYDDNTNENPIKLINEILEVLFKDSINLYVNHVTKILLIRKNILNKYLYKMYKYFLIYIENKYKDKTFSLEKIEKYYHKLITSKDILAQRKTHIMNEEFLLCNYTNSSINNDIADPHTKSHIYHKSTFKSLRLTILNVTHRKNSIDNCENINSGRAHMLKRSKSISLPKQTKIISKFQLLIKKYKNKSKLISDLKNENNENNENDDNNDNDNNEIVTRNRNKSIRNKSSNKNENYILNLSKKKSSINIKNKNNDNSNNIISNINSNSEAQTKKKEKTVKFNLQIPEENTNQNPTTNDSSKIVVPSPSMLYTPAVSKLKNLRPLGLEPLEKTCSDLSRFEHFKDKEDLYENISSSDDDCEDSIIEEYDIRKKLNGLNLSSRYYKSLFHLSDPETTKILFNPKEYYIWNDLCLIFKNFIFYNKKFVYLSKIFAINFNKHIKTNYKHLKYPTKLKNFICDDYYRPFLKSDLNFFKYKLLPATHGYVDKLFLSQKIYDEDNFNFIKFERILPINYYYKYRSFRIECECINNKGSVFGHLYFNHAFMMFISDTNNDPRNMSPEKKSSKHDDILMSYLYSYFEEERLKDKNKYVIIYFNEIKEIIIRRFCLNYVGYEILMKDNKSHLFNFFNKKIKNKFLEKINECVNVKLKMKNKPVNNNTNNNTNNVNSNNNNINNPNDEINVNSAIINITDGNLVNFEIINDPIIAFDKKDFKKKFTKGEINNFKYLLLLNKYSSRTYKDNNQYLIFPLLYMDSAKNIKRDLSKPICLNKPKDNNYNEIIENIISNFKCLGCHFNSHYSSSGFLLYYLVRLNPFTKCHIKLQSGRFDAPERIFSSWENYLFVLSISDENRELIPELYYNYESFINLNYLNLGYISGDKLQINDFDTNDYTNMKYDIKLDINIFEHIISLRENLEKINIIPWVNNVFGYNQFNKTTESMNIFPLSSYEQCNNFEELKQEKKREGLSIKEIYNEIQTKISLLTMGITPIQLFKTIHPTKNIFTKKTTSIFSEEYSSTKSIKRLNNNNVAERGNSTISIVSTNIINVNSDNNKNKKTRASSLEFLSVSSLINGYLDLSKYEYITKINNNPNIYTLNSNLEEKILIKSPKLLIISPENSKNLQESQEPLQFAVNSRKKQIKIEPYNNICCEIAQNIYCFCRYIDGTLQIKNGSINFSYKWKYIITSVENYSYEYQMNDKNILIFKNKILFGDEKGNLNLLEINFIYPNKKQPFKVEKIKIIKQIRVHNAYIKGILLIKRLNIIISFCNNGLITINNGYSFNIINMIDLGEKYKIKNIKISQYDLLYVLSFNNDNCFYYIKCYTLNGVEVTELKTKNKIFDFFIDEEKILVVYENSKIEFYNFENLENDSSINTLILMNCNENRKEENKIIFCNYDCSQRKILLIYDDKNVVEQSISGNC